MATLAYGSVDVGRDWRWSSWGGMDGRMMDVMGWMEGVDGVAGGEMTVTGAMSPLSLVGFALFLGTESRTCTLSSHGWIGPTPQLLAMLRGYFN